MYGTGVLAAAALGKVAPAVPLLRTDLGLSLGQAGWLVSAITAVAACSGRPPGCGSGGAAAAAPCWPALPSSR